jgi:hypothetical protein
MEVSLIFTAQAEAFQNARLGKAPGNTYKY